MRRDQNLLVVLVCAGAFIANLDSTIVNIALPTLSSEFGDIPSLVSWTVLSYLLCETGFILPFGKLSDIKGCQVRLSVWTWRFHGRINSLRRVFKHR